MTSQVLSGPSVILDGRACLAVDALLVRALTDAKRRDATVSESAVQVAADIHQVAIQFRAAALVRAGSTTTRPAVDAELPVWGAQKFSTREAARIAAVSPSYMRRIIQRGEVAATVGRGGGYLVDAASLAVWLDDREDQRKAA